MENSSPKSFWDKIGAVLTSPATALSNATRESPAVVLVAIVLVVQPIMQTGIELVKGLAEVKQDLDPSTRPITKAELDLVNDKIDYLQQLILAEIHNNQHNLGVDQSHGLVEDSKYKGFQNKLMGIQKKLDTDYQHKIKK